MVIEGAILDIQRVEVLKVQVLLPVRQVSFQVLRILFKGSKFGVKVIEDISSVEVSERRGVVFFVVGRRDDDSSNLGEMVFSFIGIQDGGGMSQVLFRFPGVVSSGVAFPFDEVNMSSSLSFVSDHHLHFVLMFSHNKVRWGTQVIGSVDIVFLIWR